MWPGIVPTIVHKVGVADPRRRRRSPLKTTIFKKRKKESDSFSLTSGKKTRRTFFKLESKQHNSLPAFGGKAREARYDRMKRKLVTVAQPNFFITFGIFTFVF